MKMKKMMLQPPCRLLEVSKNESCRLAFTAQSGMLAR
jgi:hypothetical protein